MEISSIQQAKALMVDQLFAGNVANQTDAAAKNEELAEVAKADDGHQHDVSPAQEAGKGEKIDIHV